MLPRSLLMNICLYLESPGRFVRSMLCICVMACAHHRPHCPAAWVMRAKVLICRSRPLRTESQHLKFHGWWHMPFQRKVSRSRTSFKGTWNSAIPVMGFRGGLPGRDVCVGEPLPLIEPLWSKIGAG